MNRFFTKVTSPVGTTVAIAVAIAPWATTTFGPDVEGRFFPVVVQTRVLQVERVGPYAARVWGDSWRVRNCTFRSLEWYYGQPDAKVRVAVVFEEPPKVRPTGYFEFGSWLISLPANQLRENSYAVAVHECHPGYLTRTLFFPNFSDALTDAYPPPSNGSDDK